MHECVKNVYASPETFGYTLVNCPASSISGCARSVIQLEGKL